MLHWAWPWRHLINQKEGIWYVWRWINIHTLGPCCVVCRMFLLESITIFVWYSIQWRNHFLTRGFTSLNPIQTWNIYISKPFLVKCILQTEAEFNFDAFCIYPFYNPINMIKSTINPKIFCNRLNIKFISNKYILRTSNNKEKE